MMKHKIWIICLKLQLHGYDYKCEVYGISRFVSGGHIWLQMTTTPYKVC